MTDEKPANPHDAYLQPATARILAVIRRELAAVIVPELHSEGAKLMASNIDYFLRYLIVREETAPAVIEDLVGQYPPANGRDEGEESGEHWAKALERRLSAAAGSDVGPRPRGSTIRDEACVTAILAEGRYIDRGVGLEDGLPQLTWPPTEAARRAVTPDRLASYLALRLEDAEGLAVTRIDQANGGHSKETFVVHLNSRAGPKAVVFRFGGPYGPVPTTIEEEFVVVRAMYDAGLKVARPLILESDPSFFGRPFIVSEKAGGTVIPHTVGMTVQPKEKERAFQLAEFLAKLHGLDVARLELPASWKGRSRSIRECLKDQVEFWEAEWELCRLEPSPTVSCAFAWLRRNLPDRPAPARLIHGDAGLHNMLIENDRMTAMLDWELAHLGDPAEDMKHCRMWTDQIVPWEDFRRHYHQHGGPEFDMNNNAFYLVMDDVRTRVMATRSIHGFIEATHPELIQLHGGVKYGRMFNAPITSVIVGHGPG